MPVVSVVLLVGWHGGAKCCHSVLLFYCFLSLITSVGDAGRGCWSGGETALWRGRTGVRHVGGEALKAGVLAGITVVVIVLLRVTVLVSVLQLLQFLGHFVGTFQFLLVVLGELNVPAV